MTALWTSSSPTGTTTRHRAKGLPRAFAHQAGEIATMTSQRARPPRLVRRLSNGHLVDTVEGGPVTLDFVVDLVCLGEDISICDEASREDRTQAVLAPASFERLRRGEGSPSSVEGVALARAIKALGDVRSAFERIAGLERLLQGAVQHDADSARANAEAAGGPPTTASRSSLRRARTPDE
jgi:polyhydroxyalkanoate synthesis regulator protein